MNIGGVGDVGFAGMVPGLAVGASPGVVAASSLSAATTGRFDQLVQLLNGFSTSEILVALMLANGASSHHQSTVEPIDSELGSQLGLALLGQVASANPIVSAPPPVLTGAQLNVQA